MEISKRVSTITLVVLLVIVCVVIGVVCYILGFFNVATEDESMSYDEPTQIVEEYQIKEFATSIEGQNNITILDSGEKVNCSQGIFSKYVLGDFEIENFDISCIDGITKISCTVTNKANERKTLDGFYIYLNDEENVCKACKLVEGMTLSSEDTKEIDVIIESDVSNTYSIVLKEVYSK